MYLLKAGLERSIINIRIKEDIQMISNIIHPKLRIILFTVICMIIPVFLIFCPNTAKAEANAATWSWATNTPEVYSSTAIIDMDPSSCQGVYQMKEIKGENGSKNVCVMAGEKVRLGTYYSGGNLSAAVSFAYDSKMYKVWGACDRSNSCLYLPGSDTLITKQYLINGYVRSLVVYKNFVSRLKPTINGINLEYNFDATEPDYIFRSSDGYAWPVGGYGASDNGQWLAIEFRQRGIGLLNIKTLEMKRVSIMAFSYGTGYDPTSELAVSNNGEHLAVMGMNSGISIFDVDPNCGDEATDTRMTDVRFIDYPCKAAQINTADFIYRFSNAFHPRFNDDGGELNFYATSYENELREVSLRASGYGGQRLDYLALGDSFTSGEGETDDKYYLPGTNDEFEKCHVSKRSYPYLIANLSNIDMSYMESVACSGATTKDVIGDDIFYPGQGGRLGKNNLKLHDADMTLAKTQAKFSFLPGRIHQLGFVKEYQPKVITIGIGGNDVGFMEKLSACIGTDICSWASSAEDKEQTAIEIKNLYSTLVNTYQEVHNASPKAKIYAFGYPKVIAENGTCSLVLGKLLDSVERRFMNEGVMYINKIVEAAAREVGIGYVDIQDSYGDQVLCGSIKPSAMNGIRTGDDNSISNSLDWAKVIGQESFHPNSLGHSFVANSIIDLVGNISSYQYCVNGATVCPSDTPAPEPSTYWIPDINHNYPTQKIANFVSDSDTPVDNRKKQIVLDDNSLAPNSSVNVEITSNPVSLGQFTANSDGALNVDIDLPVGIEEGYHTVHLYGTSYSGESIELYQVLKYTKPMVVSEKPIGNSFENVVPNTTTQPTVDGISVSKKNKQPIDTVLADNSLAVQLGDVAPSYSEQAVKGASIVANKPSMIARVDNNKSLNVNPIVIWGMISLLLIVVSALIARLIRKTRE